MNQIAIPGIPRKPRVLTNAERLATWTQEARAEAKRMIAQLPKFKGRK